jgi:hypothetical protein
MGYAVPSQNSTAIWGLFPLPRVTAGHPPLQWGKVTGGPIRPLFHAMVSWGWLAERLFSVLSPEFGPLSRRPLLASEEGTARASLWFPSADVHESDEAITFHCDLPGLKKEDVQVMEGGGRQGHGGRTQCICGSGIAVGITGGAARNGFS